MAILFRAENKQVMKIRVVSGECTVDAGGLRFLWLSGVKPADSVELLESFVRGADLDARDAEKMSHGALTAIAMHGDGAADRALESFTRPEQPSSLRRQTAFWLGEARGAAGVRPLRKVGERGARPYVCAHVGFSRSVRPQ